MKHFKVNKIIAGQARDTQLHLFYYMLGPAYFLSLFFFFFLPENKLSVNYFF